MDIKLKKRIVGLTLLIGAGLIIAPIFFSHNVNSDELRLSAHIPQAPAKPQTIDAIKPHVSAAPTNAAGPSIVFEELQSVSGKDAESNPISTTPKAASPHSSIEIPGQLANAEKPLSPILLTTVSPSESSKSSIVPLSTMQPATSTMTPVSAPPATANDASPTVTASSSSVSTSSAKSLPPTDAQSAESAKDSNLTDEDAPPLDLDEDAPPTVTPAPKVKATPSKAKVVAPKAKPVTANKTHKTTHGVPAVQAWAVQLGSFSAKINAEKLMKTLQSQGYAAYVQTIKTSKGTTLTKVLVGPELRRDDAAKIQAKLKGVNANAMLVKVQT